MNHLKLKPVDVDHATAESTTPAIDLSSCDREQVQFSGAIQPHGVLLALQEPGLWVSEVSANTEELLGVPFAKILDKPLACALPHGDDEWILQRARDLDLGPLPAHLGTTLGGLRRFEVFAHRMNRKLILELELVAPEKVDATVLYAEVRACIAELQRGRDVTSLLELAVWYIRKITKYDRVLAYKFLEDGTGQIQAEAKRDDLSSFVGLHFPPGDVPEPARRVLSLVWVRDQPDTAYTPVPIESCDPSAAPLDLGYSMLRSTSAMCNRYYQNLGVRAKLVVALLKDGEMWGAIICQNQNPKRIHNETRMACETIAHAVSLSIHDKETAAYSQAAISVRQRVESLIDRISEDQWWISSLADGLCECFAGGGAAVLLEGGALLRGKTPSEAQVLALAEWFESRDALSPEGVFATNNLAARFSPAEQYRAIASGVLAVRLKRGEYLIWFRPQVRYEVTWAGDPQKPVEIDERDGRLRLAPRTSFEMRRTLVNGLAERWMPYETEAATALAQAIGTIRRADSLASSLGDLQAANSSLESFALIAAHDLREPLRGIRMFSQMLSISLPENLDDQAKARLATIDRLAQRMDRLLQSLLHYSRTGRAELKRHRTDLNAVLAQALDSVSHVLTAANASVRVLQTLPEVGCDAVQVHEIFVNLILNGVKYNNAPAKVIEVGYREEPEPAVFVRDNGIGIATEHHDAVFKIFRRLHGRDEYGGGTGAGLSIVQRIVQNHGGKIWVESTPGHGSTFLFTLSDTRVQPARGAKTAGQS